MRIEITNNTSATWFRRLHSLQYATWLIPPNEYLNPRQCILCTVQTTKITGNYSGQLGYSVVLEGDEFVLDVSFDIPFIGESKFTSVVKRININGNLLPENFEDIFILTREVLGTRDNVKQMRFAIGETQKGTEYMRKCSQDLMDYIKAYRQPLGSMVYGPMSLSGGMYDIKLLNTSSTDVLSNGDVWWYPILNHNIQRNPRNVEILQNCPKNFVWNIKNVSWKEKLRTSHRSLIIRIVNLTSSFMVRTTPLKAKYFLEEGSWDEFPAEVIPPNCYSEFGVHNDRFLVGTQGKVQYAFVSGQNQPAEKNKLIRFWWLQPSLGNIKAGEQNLSKFSVYKRVESLNEASLFYHVIDPSDCPPLMILRARALPPLGLSAVHDWSTRGVDVLAALFSYIKEATSAQKGVQDLNSLQFSQQQIIIAQELHIVSPRSFFCSSVMANDTSEVWTEVMSNYALYLEWQIGPETFRKIWGPDDRVWLNGGVEAGVQDKTVALRATASDDMRRYAPLLLYLHKLDLSGNGGNDLSTEAVHKLIASTPIAEERILEAVVAIARIFAQGFVPIIDDTMKTCYGDDWRKICGIPKQHVWNEPAHGLDSVIDLDGVLFLLNMAWEDFFDDLFKIENKNIIRQLQIVAAYWMDQDTASLDAEMAFSFYKNCIKLLKQAGAQSSAMAVDQIFRGLFNPEGAGQFSVFS